MTTTTRLRPRAQSRLRAGIGVAILLLLACTTWAAAAASAASPSDPPAASDPPPSDPPAGASADFDSDPSPSAALGQLSSLRPSGHSAPIRVQVIRDGCDVQVSGSTQRQHSAAQRRVRLREGGAVSAVMAQTLCLCHSLTDVRRLTAV
jgi:hypothetical protein